mmetsp:Transcript_13887/g.47999  ORF Transcript_13887/g.47999 Transcript_13887/m.47999 type:complete len:209 (+) Transcript_13887:1291-1917(+)
MSVLCLNHLGAILAEELDQNFARNLIVLINCCQHVLLKRNKSLSALLRLSTSLAVPFRATSLLLAILRFLRRFHHFRSARRHFHPCISVPEPQPPIFTVVLLLRWTIGTLHVSTPVQPPRVSPVDASVNGSSVSEGEILISLPLDAVPEEESTRNATVVPQRVHAPAAVLRIHPSLASIVRRRYGLSQRLNRKIETFAHDYNDPLYLF